MQTADFGSGDGAGGVVIQGDSKIVAAGVSEGEVALARYGADGSIDAGFAGDGKLTTISAGELRGLRCRGPGECQIVAAGDAVGAFAIARYNADGSLDTTFSSGGAQGALHSPAARHK